MRLPVRRTEELRKGRVSAPGAGYFLTLCEAARRPGLSRSATSEVCRQALDELHKSGDFRSVAAVLMPDHLHLVGMLGERLSLAHVVGRFKAHTKFALERQGLKWQENFYEHRLRPGDDLEAYVRYVFLNPYRADLIPLAEPWPGWWRWGDIRFGFESILELDHRVPPQWLGYPNPAGIAE